MAIQRSGSIESFLYATNPAEKEEPTTFTEKVKIVLSNITVEPVTVLYILPSVMTSIAMQNLNLEKACRVNLHMDEETCDGMASRNSSMYNSSDEVIVQKLVASMYAWKNIIDSVFPAILLLFLGAWSDRHNRKKPVILLPMFGEILTCVGFLLCTYFFCELPMEFNGISESVPSALTGGWFAMFMGIYSYISKITSVSTRTIRIGAVNIFNNVSLTLGMALSGILYKMIGFYGIFSVAIVLYLIGLVYGIIRIKEDQSEQPPIDTPKTCFLKDFFSWNHVMETFKVAFKQGERNRKKRVCSIMILVMVIMGPLHGELGVTYLFTRYKFKWNEIDFSIFATFTVVLHIIGTLCSLAFFSKMLKMDDALLGMISCISKILSCFVYAFAPNSTVFYLGTVVEMLNGTSFIAMRSLMSKLVPPSELGKVNSLFGVSEALIPLIYGPMYSMIYRMTINILPGTFFLLGGFLTLPAVGIFFWLYTENKRDERENQRKLLEHNQELLTKSSTTEINNIITIP